MGNTPTTQSKSHTDSEQPASLPKWNRGTQPHPEQTVKPASPLASLRGPIYGTPQNGTTEDGRIVHENEDDLEEMRLAFDRQKSLFEELRREYEYVFFAYF